MVNRGCNALVRNSSLFKTEEECRAAVILELDQMISLYVAGAIQTAYCCLKWVFLFDWGLV